MSNGRRKKELHCKVCDLEPPILQIVDEMLYLSGGNTRISDINKSLIAKGVKPPSKTMLNRHRDNNHWKSTEALDGGFETPDSPLATAAAKIKSNVNMIERVGLRITKVLLPQIAIIPDQINTLNEEQEIYVFLKSELANEIEVMKNTPRVYIDPLDPDSEPYYYTSTSKNAKDVIKLMQGSLKSIREVSRDIKTNETLTTELAFALMELVGDKQDEITQLTEMLYDIEDVIDNDTKEEVTEEVDYPNIGND